MGKAKSVRIIKLTSSGHTECVADQNYAHTMLSQALSEGYFAYCEPGNVIISQVSELSTRRLEKVILYAPIAGGFKYETNSTQIR